ncbi:MAG TPA: MarR family transcriptional regulator [Chryseosolibacter sp.]
MHEEPYGEYSFLLDRTARRVKQFAQQRFKVLKFPVTVDQWLIMKNIYERGAMKQNELAELVFKDNPTVTRIIDLLCDKKLVARNPHPNDRRSFQIELTREGKKKVDQLKPKIADIRLQAWEGLSEKDFQHFKKVLNTIYKNLE